jgi:hypothetical protein
MLTDAGEFRKSDLVRERPAVKLAATADQDEYPRRSCVTQKSRSGYYVRVEPSARFTFDEVLTALIVTIDDKQANRVWRVRAGLPRPVTASRTSGSTG